MKKIVVAPQIVIYQNIFTKSKEFIKFFEDDMKKNNYNVVHLESNILCYK